MKGFPGNMPKNGSIRPLPPVTVSSAFKRPALACPLNYIEMQGQMNKPIFIVGSPRSGTSILTWCWVSIPIFSQFRNRIGWENSV